MKSEMEQVLRGVAQKLTVPALVPRQLTEDEEAQYFNQILRESGLLRLLEAGQKVRDCSLACEECQDEYDAAKAAIKEAFK